MRNRRRARMDPSSGLRLWTLWNMLGLSLGNGKSACFVKLDYAVV